MIKMIDGISVEMTDAEVKEFLKNQQQYASKVPQIITIRQAKLALLDAGLLDTVNTAISKASRNVQIEWEYAKDVERTWPTLLEVQTSLGLTDKQIDDLFVLASTK